ncbi:hypothetical protein AbraIFM66950_000476, partial [Aspergillus brasiliensis]
VFQTQPVVLGTTEFRVSPHNDLLTIVTARCTQLGRNQVGRILIKGSGIEAGYHLVRQRQTTRHGLLVAWVDLDATEAIRGEGGLKGT